jgi:Zn finger protein HypA/HybF involved in hydrogenase expression
MRKEYRDLVICNSCQWAASLLIDSYAFSKCPKCMSDNIKIVPVEDDRTKTTQITKIASKLIVSNNRATL